MNEQQNLTFHLGMSNVPSDIACDDNALEESLGMLFDKGEHRPTQTPVSFGTVSCTALLQYISEHYSDVNDYRTPTNIKFLFAHKFNDITRYFFAIEYELKVKNDQNVYESDRYPSPVIHHS